MKYEAKIDLWIKLMFYLTILIIIGPTFIMPSEEILPYILITLPVNITIMWMMFGSYIEFRDEELYIKLGPIYRRVKYDNIKSILPNSSWSSSYSMTMKRVSIKIHSKTWINSDLQIGPKNRLEFIDDLTRRCRNLE